MRKALYILDKRAFSLIYGPDEQREITELVDIIGEPQTRKSILDRPELLQDVEIILSGWGAPVLDAGFLSAAPNLQAVFYGAGSVRSFVTDEFWNRGIALTNAYAANAVPVSEYTLATILFSLKQGWGFALANKGLCPAPSRESIPGAFGSTVGLASLGMIGRLVRERLRPFDLKIIAFDPHCDPATARDLDVTPVSLDQLFARSDVVSLHTPLLDETRNLIRGQHFESMKPNATFINTARGAIVNEPEMIEVLQRRSDIQVVLDVTSPEPPEAGSPLYTLPNVILTPHIAGSVHTECRRLARYIIDELHRFLNGEPLRWELSREKAATLA